MLTRTDMLFHTMQPLSISPTLRGIVYDELLHGPTPTVSVNGLDGLIHFVSARLTALTLNA